MKKKKGLQNKNITIYPQTKKFCFHPYLQLNKIYVVGILLLSFSHLGESLIIPSVLLELVNITQ